jgi:metal-dependent amidase/aminoacylase/carboxypeptidase family protein
MFSELLRIADIVRSAFSLFSEPSRIAEHCVLGPSNSPPRRHFSADRVRETGPASASEDFGSFGAEWHAPSVFWFVGGTDPECYAQAKEAGRLNEIPTNHSPRFAPVIHPTLQTGIEALIVAARAWLAP